jgi:DNA ligase (NAD+)
MLADAADVFALPKRRAELLELPRMAAKSVDNLLVSIEEARTGRTLVQLLTGLGIPLVGGVAAAAIAERFRTLEALLDASPKEVHAALSEVHGIGPKIADSVERWLKGDEQRAVLKKLLALDLQLKAPAATVTEGPLLGMSFCVTGTLSEPREQIHGMIRDAGGQVHDRVGKGTTYLVAGDKVGQNKRGAAEKKGTKVIDEATLRAMIAGK